ncbi:hypothetical protein LTR66_009972 [Elasticomyces elasticus]|nr:hypothetical protein LTR66_009972 [Elasticomyces elasticus]KAK4984177.1 hypothetical protein LTR50_006761 [Elasticomyces elasticus]
MFRQLAPDNPGHSDENRPESQENRPRSEHPGAPRTPKRTRSPCHLCLEDDGSVYRIGRCTLCVSCILDLVDTGLKHDRYFPPTCCGKLPLVPDYTLLLDGPTLEAFVAKWKELGHDISKRVACAKCNKCTLPNKGRQEEGSDKIRTCRYCGSYTCATCTQAVHEPVDGHVCVDPLQHFLDENPKEAWRFTKCPKPRGCGQWVEKVDGCNHLSCVVCRYHFCLICKEEWRGKHKCPVFGAPGTQSDDQEWEQDWDSDDEDEDDDEDDDEIYD